MSANSTAIRRTAKSYVVGGLFWLDDKRTTIAFGRYLDRLEKRSGEWRMHTRKCTIEMSADCDGSWVHSPAVKGFLKARWDGKDPSYERPFVAALRGCGGRGWKRFERNPESLNHFQILPLWGRCRAERGGGGQSNGSPLAPSDPPSAGHLPQRGEIFASDIPWFAL